MGEPGPWQQYLEARVYGLGSEIAAAERRGYEQAITHLRDTDAFMAWAVARMPVLHAVRVADAINAADYLSARLTEGDDEWLTRRES